METNQKIQQNKLTLYTHVAMAIYFILFFDNPAI